MKKRLLLLLRTGVAVAGIAFIIAKVNLYDHVEVPADTPLPDGQTVDGPIKLKVVSGTYNPSDLSGELVVQMGAGTATERMIPIPQAALGADVQSGGLRFVPGLFTMLRHADGLQLILGLIVVAVLYPILSVRWWLLMRARRIFVTLWKAFRLTMVGNFFNFCMPGTTGGDVVKAYYAAKGSGRRADAIMSVIVDRACGLSGLLVLAGVAGLFMLDNDVARRLTVYTWLIGIGVLTAAGVYFSERMRRRLGVAWLLGKLPAKRFLAPIDQAAFAYRHHKRVVIVSILMSVCLHIVLVCATSLAGYALGIKTPLGLLLVVIPVTFLVGAIPIAPPQGIGVMEFVAVILLKPPLAFPNQIFGMLIMIRLYQMFYSLLGSMFLLKGEIHLHTQIAQENTDNAEQGQDPSPINR